MTTALAIPYTFCYRCGYQHRWVHHHCGELGPATKEVAGMLASAFGMKSEELALGGACLIVGELLDSRALKTLGTYIAGKSMHDSFGITLKDIADSHETE